MNDSKSWVKGIKCYKQFRDVDDMNDSVWQAQGSTCYEQLRVVDDMKDWRSCDLGPLDAMNDFDSWSQGCRFYE